MYSHVVEFVKAMMVASTKSLGRENSIFRRTFDMVTGSMKAFGIFEYAICRMSFVDDHSPSSIKTIPSA